VIGEALGGKVERSMTCTAAPGEQVDGQAVVDITCTGPLPLVFLPTGSFRLTVHGHAIEEAQQP
jgi:hypothetical protein